MTIRGWKTRYREIRNVFGYRKYDDLISAKKLNSKIGKRYPLSNIKKTIRGRVQTTYISIKDSSGKKVYSKHWASVKMQVV